MVYRLRRHPLPIDAFFTHSLVLTYGYPAKMLQQLLPPGLTVDTYGDYGFIAIAMVQTRRLHPAFLPAALGVDFFLTGYRVFTRFATKPSLRGLKILRSDTDRLLMAVGGNLLTHYGYVHCRAAMKAEGRPLPISRTRAALRVRSPIPSTTSRRPTPS